MRALSVGDVNQLGYDTRQAQRRRTVMPQSVARHGEPASLLVVDAQRAVPDVGAEGAVLFGQIGDTARGLSSFSALDDAIKTTATGTTRGEIQEHETV